MFFIDLQLKVNGVWRMCPDTVLPHRDRVERHVPAETFRGQTDYEINVALLFLPKFLPLTFTLI